MRGNETQVASFKTSRMLTYDAYLSIRRISSAVRLGAAANGVMVHWRIDVCNRFLTIRIDVEGSKTGAQRILQRSRRKRKVEHD